MNGSLKIQSSDKTLGTLQNILFLHKNAFAERLQKILIVKKRIIHKETLIEIHIHIHMYVCMYIYKLYENQISLLFSFENK